MTILCVMILLSVNKLVLASLVQIVLVLCTYFVREHLNPSS